MELLFDYLKTNGYLSARRECFVTKLGLLNINGVKISLVKIRCANSCTQQSTFVYISHEVKTKNVQHQYFNAHETAHPNRKCDS